MADDDAAKALAVKVHGLATVGRHWFPLITDKMARAVLDLHAVDEQLRLISHQLCDLPAVRDLVLIRDDLHGFVLRSMESMAATGDALVEIADDYLATDQAVRDHYASILSTQPLSASEKNNSGTTLPRPGESNLGGRGAQAM